MNRETKVTGRIWCITDEGSSLIADIDTDQIYHNSHLAVTDVASMGAFAFGNLEGWEDFPEKAGAGDILVVGKNFGAGSSRQQAVDCFRSLGISAILGESFGAIYKRNAINSGFPLLSCPHIGAGELKTGDHIEVDFQTGKITGMERDKVLLQCQPFSHVQMQIYKAGHLFAHGKKGD